MSWTRTIAGFILPCIIILILIGNNGGIMFLIKQSSHIDYTFEYWSEDGERLTQTVDVSSAADKLVGLFSSASPHFLILDYGDNLKCNHALTFYVNSIFKLKFYISNSGTGDFVKLSFLPYGFADSTFYNELQIVLSPFKEGYNAVGAG